MSLIKQKKLLWIDDDILNLTAYVDALRECDFDVITALNGQEALENFKKFDPPVIIADIKMPPPNGIEIIRRMHQLNPNKTYAVLSSFLYLQNYREELSLLSFPVQLIDKDFPNVNDESFEQRFVEPIRSLFEKGVTYTVKNSSESNQAIEGIDPFSIEYTQFMALPITEKDRLLDKAENLAHNTIQKAFSRGKIWLLLCGNKDEAITFAVNYDEIPPEDEILKQAQRRNRAPYQFSRALKIDDHWTTCSSNNSMKNYPTITLLIDGEEMDLHFDTGCPFSLFSYEELRARNIINPPSNFVKEIRNGFPEYRFVMVKDLIGLIKSQKSDQTLRIVLNGKAVREWINTSYSRTCDKKCSVDKQHRIGDLCPLRRALIGRNILTDNALALTLDGASQKTFFKGE